MYLYIFISYEIELFNISNLENVNITFGTDLMGLIFSLDTALSASLDGIRLGLPSVKSIT